MSIIDTSRTFEHFPEGSICPICRGSADLPCVLVGIPGTEDGNIMQASPVHVRCAEFFNDMHEQADRKGRDER